VKLLLDLGAPVNDVDRNGETAMHGPAWRGSNEAVMLLVNAGARLDVRNSRGWMPLTIAAGVYHNARIMMNHHTAQLLRELMTARGMDTSDKGANIGGALRGEVEDETQADAQSPAEIQRRLVEQLKKRQEALQLLESEAK
jgi:ankyrin repeat protein